MKSSTTASAETSEATMHLKVVALEDARFFGFLLALALLLLFLFQLLLLLRMLLPFLLCLLLMLLLHPLFLRLICLSCRSLGALLFLLLLFVQTGLEVCDGVVRAAGGLSSG